MANGKRKIQAITMTVYVEQTGRPAQPTKAELADALIATLQGREVTVTYGRDRLAQDMTVIGAYSNVASQDDQKKGPDLMALRLGTEV